MDGEASFVDLRRGRRLEPPQIPVDGASFEVRGHAAPDEGRVMRLRLLFGFPPGDVFREAGCAHFFYAGDSFAARTSGLLSCFFHAAFFGAV